MLNNQFNYHNEYSKSSSGNLCYIINEENFNSDSKNIDDIINYSDFCNKYYICKHEQTLHSKEGALIFLQSIILKKKKALFNLFDINSFLYNNADIKNIIIEFAFENNLKVAFKNNPKYKDFIYNKLIDLEIIKRKEKVDDIINEYIYSIDDDFDTFIDKYKFCIFYSELKKKNCCDNFICYNRNIYPTKKKLSFCRKVILRFEKLRNKLETKKCGICPQITIFYILGFLLLGVFIYFVWFIIKIIDIGFIEYNFLFFLSLTLLLFMLPILLCLFDLSYKKTRNLFKQCFYCFNYNKSLENQKKNLLKISNKATISDLICCKYDADPIYPGLKRSNRFLKCLQFILYKLKSIKIKKIKSYYVDDDDDQYILR